MPHPIRGTNQIWLVTRHQYGISALVSQTSFRGETRGVAKCRLCSQATVINHFYVAIIHLIYSKLFVDSKQEEEEEEEEEEWFAGSTSSKWFFAYPIPDRIGIWKSCFLRRRENRSSRRKTSQSKGENQQQTRPTYGVDARIWSRATLVGGERSHHCAIPYFPTMETILTQN